MPNRAVVSAPDRSKVEAITAAAGGKQNKMMMVIYVAIMLWAVLRNTTELNRASMAVVRQVISTIDKKAATPNRFDQ